MKKKRKIKIPGNLKMKKLILILLIILAILILVVNFIENKSNKFNRKLNVKDNTNLEENKIMENTLEEDLYSQARGLFFTEGNYEKTIEKANDIINKFPQSYKGYSIRGIAKAYNGNFQEGMNDIDKALEFNPDFGYGRFNKALTYELYGEYDKALIWYDKALEIEEYVWSYYGKASIYGRKGDVENTVKYLGIAISMEDSVKEEAKKEEDFDKIRYSKEFQKLINN